MSTILKALRRLEDDRAIREQRPLRETVTSGGNDAPEPTRRGAGRFAPLALLIGAGAGAGLLAFWSTVDNEPGEPSAPTTAAVQATAPLREAVVALPQESADPLPEAESAGAPASQQGPGPAFETARELPDAALASRVERLDRAPARPRIAADEPPATTETPAPAPRMVRGKPLVPAHSLPGRHPGVSPPVVLAIAEPTPQPEVSEPPLVEPRRSPTNPVAPPATPDRIPGRASAEPQPTSRPVSRSAPEVPPSPTASPSVESASPTPSAEERPVERPPKLEVARVEAPPAPSEPVATPAPVATLAPVASVEESAEQAPKAAAVRADVPDLFVARTSWHPSAERRSATLQDGAGEEIEVHEGDAVGPLVVSRIQPSSVIFLHQGIEIRRRVGQR
jgi:hypothetical protein